MIWWQISSEPKGRRVKQKKQQSHRERADVYNQAFSSEVQLEPHLWRDGPLLSRHVARYDHTESSAGWITFQDWPWLELASVYDTSEGFGVIRRGVILVFFLCSTVFCPCHSFQLNDQIFGHSSTAARIFEPLKIPIALNQTGVMSIGSLIAGFECLLECKPYCWQCELPHQCKA